ncbi:hypothetical protein CW706_02050 [Candidatus Bathyarchaeota archaeon]|nr:MAG: hypothetical protein CW706_02050 [Candidatus Bathyarchaeota archaeon]
MVQEFLKVEDPETFRLVAEQSPLVIRRDPYLFAQYFSGMFFIDLAELRQEEVKKLFRMLRNKIIMVKKIVKASSISDFLNKTKEFMV